MPIHKAEAEGILRQLQAEKGMGVNQSKAAVKTGEWMETWIEKHKAPKLAPATLTSYRNNFRIHIKPYIGDITLRELSTYHIQRCLDAIGGSCSTFVKNYNVIQGSLEVSTPTRKCSFGPKWNVILWRTACGGYAALIIR